MRILCSVRYRLSTQPGFCGRIGDKTEVLGGGQNNTKTEKAAKAVKQSDSLF